MDEQALDRLVAFCEEQWKELTCRDARSSELKLSKNGVYLIERDGAAATFQRVPWAQVLDEAGG